MLGLQDTFATIFLHIFIVTCQMKGYHSVPYAFRSFEKLLHSLFENRTFKNNGWGKQTKTTMKTEQQLPPHPQPNLPCLANSKVIICFGWDKFLSESCTLHKETPFKYAIKFASVQESRPHRAWCQHIPTRLLQEFSRIISFGTVAQ